MTAEQNERITRTGRGTPCGQLLRRYQQPAALVAEFDLALRPRMVQRPVNAVRQLWQNFGLFKYLWVS